MAPLLKGRRFVPLFVTQFLGAANDNLFKSALVVLITFQLAQRAHVSGPLMVTAAAGIFIAPFFLFSAWAGQLADRFDKAFLARCIKAAEIVIMGVAAVAFANASVWGLMAVLFLMGAQSALFGPLKYAILPQLLHEDELIAANAMVEGGTFIAILIGTIAGGLLILSDGGIALVSALVIGIAVLGFASSLFIPCVRATDASVRINPNFVFETVKMMRHAARRRDIFLAVLAISWFWLVGATFLSQFPTFAKDTLGGDEHVVTLFLAIFSIGIAVGSALSSKVLKGEVTAKYAPFAALVMSAFMVDIYFSSRQMAHLAFGDHTFGILVFLSTPSAYRILMDLMMIAAAGGLFIVPFYAILQSRGDAAHRARDIAANNVMNALFMVLSAVVIAILLSGGMTVPGVFLTTALANLAVAFYLFRKVR